MSSPARGYLTRPCLRQIKPAFVTGTSPIPCTAVMDSGWGSRGPPMPLRNVAGGAHRAILGGPRLKRHLKAGEVSIGELHLAAAAVGEDAHPHDHPAQRLHRREGVPQRAPPPADVFDTHPLPSPPNLE